MKTRIAVMIVMLVGVLFLATPAKAYDGYCIELCFDFGANMGGFCAYDTDFGWWCACADLDPYRAYVATISIGDYLGPGGEALICP